MTEIVRADTLAPGVLDERMRYARALSEAGLLPKDYRKQPANLLLVLEYAQSVGISGVQAISSVNVIDGKPCPSANLVSALVRSAGHRLRITGDDQTATCSITRSDDPDFEYLATWDMDRAVQAGLVQIRDGRPYARSREGKPLPWETYPAALLKARALTECARNACAEALCGAIYTTEELTTTPAAVPPPPPPVRVVDAEPEAVVVDEGAGRGSAVGDDVRERWRTAWMHDLDRAIDGRDLEFVKSLAKQAVEAELPDLVEQARDAWAIVRNDGATMAGAVDSQPSDR